MQTTQSVAALARRTRRRGRTVTRNAIYTWSCIQLQLQHSLTRYLRQYSIDYSLSSGFRVIGILVSALIIKSSEFRWSLRVCRLKHSGHLVVKQNWQFGERQKFARSSCRGFVAQWLERPTGNRKTRVRSPAGLRCVFFRLIQLSVHICRIEKKRSLTTIKILYKDQIFG